jgi:hypothetical protein
MVECDFHLTVSSLFFKDSITFQTTPSILSAWSVS